tara:strand:+ start:321 stop:1088 length:768 start_codon:yes stop_codon:yes gene_type:complete
MKTTNKNVLPEIVELKSYLSASSENNDELELRVEFGAFSDDIEIDQDIINVGISRINISLDFEGFDIVPASKYAMELVEDRREQEVEVTRSSGVEVISNVKKGAGGEIKIGPLDYGGGIGLHRENMKLQKQNMVQSERETYKSSTRSVMAIGNDQWKITDPAGGSLNGTYMNDISLCRMRDSRSSSNRRAVALTAYSRQRDIDINFHRDGIFSKLSNNKNKILKILITKSLSKIDRDRLYDGHVVFSQSNISDEE